MVLKMIAFSMLLFVFSTLQAQVLRELPCKFLLPKSNFVRKQFLGLWVEVLRSPRSFEGGENVKCTRINYEMIANDFKNTTRVWINKNDNSKHKFIGNATLNNVGKGVTPDGYNYTIIATDYTGYAVLYACTELEEQRADFVWLLLRHSRQCKQHSIKAVKILKKYELDYPELQYIDQDNCPENFF